VAIPGNPKKMAQDIAEGYIMLSPPMLRSYSLADFKTILANLAMVTRELRSEKIPLENIMGLKSRNMQLSRLHQAETVIRAYCKKRRIPI
jgi:hypothetical protein